MSEYIYRAEPIGEGEYNHTLVGELVRCGECIHLTNDRICPHWYRICELTAGGKAESGYCDEGIRRADDE